MTKRIFTFTATSEKGEALTWTIRHWSANWAKLELPYPYRLTAVLVNS